MRSRSLAGRPAYPDGHFYSPVVDTAAVAAAGAEAIWPAAPTVAAIDFNDAGHVQVLTELFPRFIGDYDYPEHADGDLPASAFYTQNPSSHGSTPARCSCCCAPGGRVASSRSDRAIRRC